MKRVFLLLLAATMLLSACTKQPVHLTFVPDYEATIDSLVEASLADTLIPGAVVCVVRADGATFTRAYGYRQVYPDTIAMTENTIFDLASLSKCVGTAVSFHHMMAECLYEQDSIRIEDKVNKYLPEFEGEATIADLMTHTSGLPAYVSPITLERLHQTPYEYICTCDRLCPPASVDTAAAVCRYSCLNFITLQFILEKVTGERLCDYAQKHIYAELGMTHTTYLPFDCADTLATAPWNRVEEYKGYPIAPTELQPDGLCLQGNVHDPLARVGNHGNSGNAGVFSCAEDLAKLSHALLSYDGPMVQIPEGYEKFGRSLGWDVCSDYAWLKGDYASASAVCHTGYTGTSIVIDREKGLALIILTNRVHPYDDGGTASIRRGIADVVFK